MNEWICKEIKEPIDLKRPNWNFFRGGLALPKTTYDPEADQAEADLIELMIGILKGQIEEDKENIREFMSRL